MSATLNQEQLPLLLVEDEALIRMGAAMDLQDAGLQVVEAASGDEAVAMLTGGLLVGAVITDVRMPGSIDGFGVVRWLNKHRPGVPVIIASGYPVDLAIEGMRVSAVICKPYKARHIISELGLFAGR
jgi:CheY-like chemotaxis protein